MNNKIIIQYFEIKHFNQSLVFTSKVTINDSHLFAAFNSYNQNYRYSNIRPNDYHLRYFKDIITHTGREILKSIQNESNPTFSKMFVNDNKIENLYFILGDHNDYGILDWQINTLSSQIEIIFQVECYYNFTTFVSISGSLAHSNVSIYSNVINNPKYLKKNLHLPLKGETIAIHQE